jgi:hypothetical protein
MAMYAVMSGNTVSNIIIADNKEDAELDLNVTLIEFTDTNPAGIGWTYSEQSNTFIPPMYSNTMDVTDGL